MELLQTLSPSASHCIKCFCNFIRILCLCRCQSAVKLKLQTEILHFHPEWKLRKSIFLAGKEMAWPCPLGHSLSSFEGSLGFVPWKGGKKGALHFSWLSLAIWPISTWHGLQTESLWVLQCNPFFFLLSLSALRVPGEVLVLERGSNFNKKLSLKFQSFLVSRET